MVAWYEVNRRGSNVLSIHYSFGEDSSCSGEALYNKATNAFVLVQSPDGADIYQTRSFLETIQRPLMEGTLPFWQVTAATFQEWRVVSQAHIGWSSVADLSESQTQHRKA